MVLYAAIFASQAKYAWVITAGIIELLWITLIPYNALDATRPTHDS